MSFIFDCFPKHTRYTFEPDDIPSTTEVVTKAIRARGTYRYRRRGRERTTRAFGGVNVVLRVDWWQLQPVTGTCLCSNPLDAPAGRAQNAMELLWGTGLDSIRNFWELNELMRCKDPWYNHFRSCCRRGNLPKDIYCFPRSADVDIV